MVQWNPYTDWEEEPTNPLRRYPHPRVLIAEDDPDLRKLVANRLRRDGCAVIEVATGDEALCIISEIRDHETPIDGLELAIMDVRMPGLSGLEVTAHLRAMRWTTPVLLVTAFPDTSVFTEARRLNAAVLPKPFGFTRLSEAAIEALDSRPRPV